MNFIKSMFLYENMYSKVKFLSGWLFYALSIQLFLLSFSFPVLVRWGIGFSPLVFVGNIFFTPFLTLFLGISLGIYLCVLCGIPYGLLAALLNGVTVLWIKCMSWAPDMPLIGFPCAPLWVVIAIPLGAVVLVAHYTFKKPLHLSLALACWVMGLGGVISWYFTPRHQEITVICGSKKIYAQINRGTICLVDPHGALGGKACTKAWIDYTLAPELLKHFGTTRIDYLLVRDGKRNHPLIAQIVKKFHCKNIGTLYDKKTLFNPL